MGEECERLGTHGTGRSRELFERGTGTEDGGRVVGFVFQFFCSLSVIIVRSLQPPSFIFTNHSLSIVIMKVKEKGGRNRRTELRHVS